MKNYAEIYAVCAFFDKLDRGYIQCEGVAKQSHTRTLFHDLNDGHPLDGERDKFFEKYCCTFDYMNCPIYKMIMATKYKED